MKKIPEKISLFGIDITNATEKEILEYLFESLRKSEDSYYIVTPNPEIIVHAGKYSQFQRILNDARIALPDGIGVVFAGFFLGKPFRERITGVDFMEKLCQVAAVLNAAVAGKPIGVGFLGGRPGVAKKTAECLKKKYPRLSVVFAGEEWIYRGPVRSSFSTPVKQASSSLRSSAPSVQALPAMFDLVGRPPASTTPRIDILFVAFGFPKQEEWMASHVGKVPVKVMIGVGGAFDYISGSVSRAPFLIRLFGFEWLYRLIRQPWRVKRQFALFQFVFLVFREFVHLRKGKRQGRGQG